MKKLTPAQVSWTLALSLLLLLTVVFAAQTRPDETPTWHPVQVATYTPTPVPTVGWWGPTATPTSVLTPTLTP